MQKKVNASKILEGLEGEGISVSVRSLARYMSSNGVRVTPKIGRMRGYVSLPGDAYGVKPEKMTDVGQLFYKDRVTQGHMNFIPKEDEAYLAKLEKRLRRAVEERTLAELFMPLSAYDSLKEEFMTIRREYFTKRDEILTRWDNLIADFQDGASAMLDGIKITKHTKSLLMDEFMASMPTAINYKDSFYMSLKVNAFPAEVGELVGLNSSVAMDVTETWKNDVVSTAILSIEKQVGDGWEKTNKAMKQYLQKNTIRDSTLQALEKFGRDLSWKNVFQNPLLKELCQKLSSISGQSDQASILEDCIMDIFEYSAEANLDLKWTGACYPKAEIENMIAVRKMIVEREKNRTA